MRRFSIVSFGCLLLTGCMVGPDYHAPASPNAKSYTQSPLSSQFAMNQNIPAQWWTMYRSTTLNNLVQAGLKNSPTLDVAQNTLKQAQENLRAQIGSSLLPSIGAQLGGERERTSTSIPGQTTPSAVFSLYNASVNATYNFDLFGGARRQIESLAAQVDYQRFQLEAARLTLTSNIVTTTITIASLQEQINATQDMIRTQREQLRIMQKQLRLGGESGSDILLQQNQLASTEATLPVLQQRVAQSQDALAVLVGQLPSNMTLPQFDLANFSLPVKIPVSLPSRLACQRPDIRAQAALLHAASAQVGVATANLYPQITLSGAYGVSGLTTASLFTPANLAWNYGGAVLQPLFEGGALHAQRRAAVDAYNAALAQYKQTVLQGFQNVADVLQALQNDAEALKSQELAEQSARGSLAIAQKQYKVGGVSYLTVLTAEREYQAAKINLIQAKATRLTDAAALFQALGGGWWNA